MTSLEFGVSVIIFFKPNPPLAALASPLDRGAA